MLGWIKNQSKEGECFSMSEDPVMRHVWEDPPGGYSTYCTRASSCIEKSGYTYRMQKVACRDSSVFQDRQKLRI